MHDGDLAVVLRGAKYTIGDVIAYRVPEAIVIHRVIGGSPSEGYITQGDNTPAPDEWRPSYAEVLGREWFHIPGGGRILMRLQQPTMLGALVGGGLLAAEARPTTKAKTARRRRRPSRGAPRGAVLAQSSAAVVVVALLVVSMLIYSRSLPVLVSKTVQAPSYSHSLDFSYTVQVEPSDVYPSVRLGPDHLPRGSDGTEPTGGVVFTQLARAIDLRAQYALRTDLPHSLQGQVSADMVVRVGQAWERSIAVLPPTAFDGTAATVPLSLNLADLQALVARIEEQTGYSSGSYTVSLVPTFHVWGTVGDEAVDDTFSPAFRIAFSSSQITLDPELSRTEERTVTREELVENNLPVWRFSLPVRSVQRYSLLALQVSGGILALFVAALAWVGRNEVGRIRLRYGAHLVSATRVETEGARTVDVASMADLSRLAMRDGQVILEHEEAPGQVRYLVDDGRLIYVYRVGGPEPDEEGDEDES